MPTPGPPGNEEQRTLAMAGIEGWQTGQAQAQLVSVRLGRVDRYVNAGALSVRDVVTRPPLER